ncbi:signal peptide peptidase-like protein 2 [Tanacetum coccineum]
MIHLVIHLPLEALEGGPIRPRWMFPFERYMKKLKGYVRNKAKPEGSIAEGYVAEEALTFSSHYFRDVTTKFNRPDRNVDPPPPTCQFQVFRSVCKSIGLRSVIRFDAQELKKVKWYVLHNSPEIDTYRSQFKSLFPNKDMKEEFPEWFGSQIRQRHVDNDKDPEVSTTSELFALPCGPTWTPISINSCVVDSVRYVVHSRDERHITQNSGICAPGPDEEMYYCQLQEIPEFKGEAFKNDQYILVTQVKQVFYLEDKAKPYWRVVEHVNHKKFSDGGVIMVEDDPDIIHFDNSSDLLLFTSLNDLDNATLHIDGQSTKVDASPDIIDVVDQDDDITDDGDTLPRDLADSDDEDLINVNDDGVDKMSAYVARSHGDEDSPPPHHVPSSCMGCFANRGKGKRKPNLGGRAAGRLNTRDKTRNLSLKEIQQHLQKAYNTNKAAFKAQHWGSRSLARLRDEMRQSSATYEYPLLIDTFFMAHTVNGEMRRMEATGTYTDDEINLLARRGKQRGHIPGIGRVLPARATASPNIESGERTLEMRHDIISELKGKTIGRRERYKDRRARHAELFVLSSVKERLTGMTDTWLCLCKAVCLYVERDYDPIDHIVTDNKYRIGKYYQRE